MDGTTMKARVVGYLRVSTREQELGLEVQASTIKKWCAFKGHELVELYEDRGVSGQERRRHGLTDAMRALRTDEADIIVVSKLDRLSRSQAHVVQIMDDVRKLKKSVAILDISLDTSTPMGRAMVGVMSVFAELELAKIRDRTTEAMQVKKDRGDSIGRPPWGYKMSTDRRSFVKDFRTWDSVVQICRMHRRGRGIRAIAREFGVTRYLVRRVLATELPRGVGIVEGMT